MPTDPIIRLRGVEVHNLQHVDLDLPRQRLVVFCGVSGSGKSSLAFDTLYAEGQRRYIESFSAYTRQFLERLEKPAAERIEGMPPAIAVASKTPSRSSRSTVGTATEANDYLRLLMARIGEIVCYGCGRPVSRQSPQAAAETLEKLAVGTRYLVGFVPVITDAESQAALAQATLAALREAGLQRVLAAGAMLQIADSAAETALLASNPAEWLVVVDRLAAGSVTAQRLRDSLETAFDLGGQQCRVLVEPGATLPDEVGSRPRAIDGQTWQQLAFSKQLRCDTCEIDYAAPEPRLYGFNSPLGACPKCEGFGNVIDIDMDLVVPDPRKSLRDGAIAPWNTPAYKHELDELLSLAKSQELRVDVPFAELTERELQLITDGVPSHNFGGLRGFFAWLEQRKYKMHLRVYLSRWRSYRQCPECRGARLKPTSLAARIGGLNMAEITALKVWDAVKFFDTLTLTEHQQNVGRSMLQQVRARLGYLESVGLGYLTLDRTLRTLSGGESQRVALTGALGSSLVNMLYVLDEPSIGLHPQDTDRLIDAVRRLARRGNSVVVVEHEEAMIRAAEWIVEIGPGAGERGGRVVFQGTPQAMIDGGESVTGDYLAGRRGLGGTTLERRRPEQGWIRLSGACGNNLRNLTVEIPLGVLCAITGVSGSGKSTLVQDTLYPALCRRMRKEAPKPLEYGDLMGDGQLSDVVLVDQSPVGRSPRSNPVTYVKAFDEIRSVFATTIDAKSRGFGATHFSFNVEGGRCEMCQGDGQLEIDMQFMADVFMRCPQCQGQRYRREILDVHYRARNIADVLNMTVREAFTFFRGHAKVQARLKRLIDVGLDYLRLGQPANTLSGGESQRLKLAAYISASKRGRTLFLLDEPTTGLHFSDVAQLIDCFESLLAIGHSVVVVEHNMQLIRAADYLIDLGPGAAEQGGQVVAHGTPQRVAREPRSATGRYLAAELSRLAEQQSA